MKLERNLDAFTKPKGYKASAGKFRRLDGPIQTSENLFKNKFPAENRRLFTVKTDVCFCQNIGKNLRSVKQTSESKFSDGCFWVRDFFICLRAWDPSPIPLLKSDFAASISSLQHSNSPKSPFFSKP